MVTHCYVMRHGQTDWNAEGRLQGQTDIPLNNQGRTQAKKAANFIKTLDLEACYSSDLSRAFETAQIALKHHPHVKTPTLVSDLRERNFGTMNGATRAEIDQHKKDHPDFYLDLDGTGRLFPKDGEQDPIFIRRITTCFQAVVNQHQNPFLIVSHGGVIRQMIRSLAPDQDLFHPGNCHVYRLTPVQHNWTINQVWPE